MADATDDRLRLLVERIERINEEIDGLKHDRRDVYAEAKAIGYDAATILKLIARRAMKPDDRREADLILETYEAALGMGDMPEGHEAPIMRPDVTELAVALLAEQLVGIEDPDQAKMLIEHVLWLLDLRAEIAELRRQESDRKKLAKAEGFQVNQLHQTVRWYEKCAKHGEDAMRAGEQVYQLYRATVDQRDGEQPAAEIADPKLAAMFAPKPGAKGRKSLNTHRMAADMARRALRGDI